MSGKNLAAALAAFQAELPSVALDGTNPHFKSKFATLANMTHKVLPVLAKHGLSFTAAPKLTEQGFVLEASLLHESGEERTASLPIQSGKPQDVGSAMTYYRRYALAALTGVVADDDDDGNTAQAAKPAQPPAEWQKVIANAPSMDALTALLRQATAEGWVNADVMKVFNARKQVLENVRTDNADAAAAQ